MSTSIEESVFLDKNFPVKPHDIEVGEGESCGFFGKDEVEESAGKLVRYFQEIGDWTTFTFKELSTFYEKNGWNPAEMLFGLLGDWFDDGIMKLQSPWRFVVHMGDHLVVTKWFIQHCLKEPTLDYSEIMLAKRMVNRN